MQTNKSTTVRNRSAFFALVLLMFMGNVAAVGQTEDVLYTFGGGNDGTAPLYGLIADASGTLYGTTYYGGNTPCPSGCGTVFELTPQGNSWTETVLYRFQGALQGDGMYPNSGLVMDASGALYGVTYEGGPDGQNDFGDVFKLTPPVQKGGAWTESVLYDFCAQPHCYDGAGPYDSLVFDKKGNLYGTARYNGPNSAGVVYKLSPPKQGSRWKEKVLYAFTGKEDGYSPIAGLIFDAKGALYGTTQGGGTSEYGGGFGVVFKLTRQVNGTWTEKVLHSFTGVPDGALPDAGLTFDSAGLLYGTTAFGGKSTCAVVTTLGCGTVFRLTPPLKKGGAWKEKMLHVFDKDTDGAGVLVAPVLDDEGAIYATTSEAGSAGYGATVQLRPPAPGKKVWTERILHGFSGGPDGRQPAFGTLLNLNGKIYGTTVQGGPLDFPFLGVVYAVTP